ncbi:hypothetical protein TNCV_1394871, partial [Trichonephila clavipes]
GYGSPVVKVSDHVRHAMSSKPVPLKTRRVGQQCTLNLSRAETSYRWCGELRLIECSQIPMVRPLLVKERAESGFNASRTVILTSKTSMAFGGTSQHLLDTRPGY